MKPVTNETFNFNICSENLDTEKLFINHDYMGITYQTYLDLVEDIEILNLSTEGQQKGSWKSQN